MLGAVYTHYTLHDKLDRMAPGLIFGLLLITRLIIYQQTKFADLDIKNERSTNAEEKQINTNQKSSNEKKID